jgi:hypothetical protein
VFGKSSLGGLEGRRRKEKEEGGRAKKEGIISKMAGEWKE